MDAEEVDARLENLENQVAKLQRQLARVTPHFSCQTCGEADAEPEHTCPFALEIHGDEVKCNCCTGCEDDCSQSI